MVLPLIPPIAITIGAAALLILILFASTDWWEILGIVAVIGYALYMLPKLTNVKV